jgi:putative spermidine/putrescine transport system permease protein
MLIKYYKTRFIKFSNLAILPLLIYTIILFIYPLLRMFTLSLFSPSFTLEHYHHFYQAPIYLRIFSNTFRTAATVTFITLLLGYPVSYFLSSIPEKTANLLMIFIVVPFWVSILIRTFAWTVILQSNGVANVLLMRLGIINEPLRLLYNSFAVHIGMIHIQLPFMILSLYGVMKGIDRNYFNVALSLGAKPVNAFWQVYFPMSLPGVGAGTLLVFIMSLGFYITPAILGGNRDTTISMVIENQVSTILNWNFGSALAVILLVITTLIIIIYNKLLGVGKVGGI